MMNTVTIEVVGGALLRPYEDYGILLVEYDAPPPEPKIFRQEIEGRNGTLDMSLWAGEMKYNDRTVSLKLRDFGNHYRQLGNLIYGAKVMLTFSDMPDVYFLGRCERFETSTRQHVTDIEVECVCEPYAYEHVRTWFGISAVEGGSVLLYSKCHAIYPIIESTDSITATLTNTSGDEEVTLLSGVHVAPFAITPEPVMLTIAEGGTGNVQIYWRDEVLV